jgi:hypothetical protein
VPPTAQRVAIDEVASRDPIVADLVARIGPISHRPRDPDGPFGALVRAIVSSSSQAARPDEAACGDESRRKRKRGCHRPESRQIQTACCA